MTENVTVQMKVKSIKRNQYNNRSTPGRFEVTLTGPDGATLLLFTNIPPDMRWTFEVRINPIKNDEIIR